MAATILMSNELPLTVRDHEIFDATVPPDHYLRRVHTAIDFGPIRTILLSSYHPTLGRPPYEPLVLLKLEFLQYQYDLYHMQRMEGNLIATLREHIGRIGHIQVADSPERHEPGTGEIHYAHVLAALDALDYPGYVGLEYNPGGSSHESFSWLPGDKRGGIAVGALRL